MTSQKKILGIACGIFVGEVKALCKRGLLDLPFVFLNSSLHMRPDELQIKLDDAIKTGLTHYDKILLVYGDCHAYMDDAYDPLRVVRVKGINCCEIMMGSEQYRAIRREGAFFVLNEWAYKWKEIFVTDIGLNEKIAPLFMNAMHKSIVYLDTQVEVVPYEILEEMSLYFKLPYQVVTIPLKYLNEAIHAAYDEVIKR